MIETMSLSLTYNEVSNYVVKVLKSGRTPMIWGSPGVGKSSIAYTVKDILKKKSVFVIDAALFSPTDYAVNVPENGKMREYIINIPEDSIVLIDDLTMAEDYQMKPILKMVFEKRIGSVHVENLYFILTGNKMDDFTASRDLLSTIKNRVVQFTLKPSLDEWLIWAEENNIRKEIISFLLTHPDKFLEAPKEGITAWPTPRSWHIFSDVLSEYDDFMKDESSLKKIYDLGSGIVGIESSSVFFNFCKYRYDFSPEKALNTGSVGSGDRLMIYSRITSLADYIKRNGIKNKNQYTSLEKIWASLEGEYKSVFFKSLIIRKKEGKDISILTDILKNTNLDFGKFIEEITDFKK